MTGIVHTFVQVSPDCPVKTGTIPPTKQDAKPSIHVLQYQLLIQYPYRFTLKDLIYEVHIRHKQIPAEDIATHADAIREALFQKNHPCMRASMLTKKYGWGVHHDQEGKMALYGMETEEYRRFVEGGEEGLKLVYGMRNSRT